MLTFHVTHIDCNFGDIHCTDSLSNANYFPTDISIAVIDLLQEMTDVDTLNESEEGATALIDALVSFLLQKPF